MIDVVIPTMWMCKDFDKALSIYTDHDQIHKIIIIDNCDKKRPDYAVLDHPKIKLISYGRNIYVNPAWNEGYLNSSSKIIAIINDDINVSHSVFDMILEFDLKPGDLIGVNLRGCQDNYKIDEHIETPEKIVKLNYNEKNSIGGQSWAFGICMFMLRESYSIIPQLYQIWYGDDYLAQHASAVYSINSNKIKGKISETLKQFKDPDDEISKRIELDSKNLLRFNDFKNKENWDIPKNIISMYESQRFQKTNFTVSKKSMLELEYDWAIKNPSDINENVSVLYDLAKECRTVVEMGVRTGVSTRAFLNTDVKLLSFDFELDQKVQKLFNYAKNQGKDVQYIENNVLDIEVDDCDLLFIDTLHTYDQLKQELNLHGNKAKKYIVFHDTYTFGLKDEIGNGKKGLMTAIIEFMIDNPNWIFYIHKTNNNGLTVLKHV